MPKQGAIGVAIVGAGFMGRIHAEALARDLRAELRWVVDHNPDKSQAVIRAYQRTRRSRARIRESTSLQDALDDDAVNTVYVCTQPTSHWELAAAAMKADRHTFVEKPMTYTLLEGRRLLKLEAKSTRVLWIGHVCRFFPEYQRIHELVRAGDIGRPAMVRASRCMGNPGSWYEDPGYSLGVPGDLLLHDFDLLLWMFGDATRVYSFSRARRPPIGEQHFLTSLRHKNGTLSHLQGSWAHVDGFRTRFEVSGSEGVIEFDSARRAPLVYKQIKKGKTASALVVPESPAAASPYDAQTRHFLDVVLGQARPQMKAKEALRALEVALAAARSATRQEPITLAEPSPAVGAQP